MTLPVRLLLISALLFPSIPWAQSPASRSIQSVPGIVQQEGMSGRSIGPLLTTRWSEGCFFNAFCPGDTGSHNTCLRTPAGSGAVAVAQAMKYYGYPAQGAGEHGYLHPTYGIQYANFGATSYNWGAMPDTLYAALDILGTLIYHCAVAQDMDFGTLSSASAPDALDTALVRYFKYPKAATWKNRSDFTFPEWTALIRSELDAHHPLIFYGSDSLGQHARFFICDGYGENDQFHFNWGLGGQSDGYYSLDQLNPGSVNLSFNQKLLFGLAPSIPGPSSYTMDFENVADFSLSFGEWTVNDVDGHGTYGISGFTFLHQTEPMAFLCFNPSSVNPSMAGDTAIQPHGGAKFGACFSSNPPSNDDWFISPSIQLGVNGSFSFWVRSYSTLYGPDKYQVAVSTTGTDPADFTVISGAQPLTATPSWSKMTFNLSAYDNRLIHVAIRCVSNDNFLLMIDDLEVRPQAASSLAADFSASKTSLRVGEPVTFADQSSGAPTQWLWKFPGGSPASSALQEPPPVVYSSPGQYPVSLRISNGTVADSITKPGFITVSGYPVTAALDFESIQDFSLSFGSWTAHDAKGGNTYGINQPNGYPYYFLHVNEPMAFICFNPAATTPPLTNMVPHAGQKLGCSFSSVPPMNPNDKWLISPKISLGVNSKLELWVQAFNNLYGDEKYNIAVSLTDKNPSDFTRVNGAPEIAPLEWTRRVYDLSYYDNQDVHVGIQCVTNNSFIFMVDDISVTSSLGSGEESDDVVRAFPNPASEEVILVLRNPGLSAYTITLVTLSGTEAASWTMRPDGNRIRLRLPPVPDGLYLLRVDSGRHFSTIKCSIQH